MPLKVWVPDGDGYYRDAYIPPSRLEDTRRGMVHEAGHIEVARHFNFPIIGVALQLEPAGLRPVALNRIPNIVSPKTRCTIWGGGSASEVLHYGEYFVPDASGDKADIEQLLPNADYDSFVEQARCILLQRRQTLDALVALLFKKLDSNLEFRVGTLDSGVMGTLILSQAELPR